MSRFYADITGGRGTATRQGHAATGIRGHIRGWNSGVEVVGRAFGETDLFDVYATAGSGGSRSRVHVGTVHVVDDVPTFSPVRATGDPMAGRVNYDPARGA